MKKIAVSMIAVLFVCLGLAAGEAKADLTYDVKYLLSGTPVTTGTYDLQAVFKTISAGTNSGSVELTLTANLTDALLYIQQVAFNVTNDKFKTIDITVKSASGVVLDGYSYNQDKARLNGGGELSKGFDILLDFLTSNSDTNRFNGTDSLVLIITGKDKNNNLVTMTAADFAFMNVGQNDKGANTANVIAKLAGNGNSFEVTNVPVPAAAWLLGSGLIGLAGIRRKLKK